jgi:hypothetical protein
MLVEVKHKETGKVALITPHAYNLAKKRYIFIRNVSDNNANVFTPEAHQDEQPEMPQVPNLKPQTPEPPVEKESGAAPAVNNPVVNETAPAKGKPGRKPKTQISSQAESVEA